jgi:hypothetical protein
MSQKICQFICWILLLHTCALADTRSLLLPKIGSQEYPRYISETGNPHNLSESEFMSLAFYVEEGYEIVNPWLRSGTLPKNEPTFTPTAIQEWIDDFDRCLKKLPAHTGKSYRGAHLRRSLVNQWQVGSEFIDPGYLSTSRSAETALAFAHDYAQENPTPDYVTVFFILDGWNGRSTWDAGLENQIDVVRGSAEEEILYRRGTHFRVLEVHSDYNIELSKYGSTFTFPEIISITLREIRP